MTDKVEQRFLKEMRIDPKTKIPVVVVFNAKGDITDVHRKGVNAAMLVASAKKKKECCPGGGC